jgi:hypothetical protein
LRSRIKVISESPNLTRLGIRAGGSLMGKYDSSNKNIEAVMHSSKKNQAGHFLYQDIRHSVPSVFLLVAGDGINSENR